jgi:hypothetical protein
MADDTPEKIIFGIGNGRSRSMQRLPDGSYADRVAISAGAGLITDNTGRFTFDLSSLASQPEYDDEGNQVKITYGPDQHGRYVMQESRWLPGNVWNGDTDWTVVDGQGKPVGAKP